MPSHAQRNVRPSVYVLERCGNRNGKNSGIACARLAVAKVIHQPDRSAADTRGPLLSGMRRGRENSRKRADAFEMQDATRLDGRFVNGRDIKGMAFFGGWVREEVFGRWDIECRGGSDKAEEGGSLEIHLAGRHSSISI